MEKKDRAPSPLAKRMRYALVHGKRKGGKRGKARRRGAR